MTAAFLSEADSCVLMWPPGHRRHRNHPASSLLFRAWRWPELRLWRCGGEPLTHLYPNALSHVLLLHESPHLCQKVTTDTD